MDQRKPRRKRFCKEVKISLTFSYSSTNNYKSVAYLFPYLFCDSVSFVALEGNSVNHYLERSKYNISNNIVTQSNDK